MNSQVILGVLPDCEKDKIASKSYKAVKLG
jgi:hypothetical protein